jgi:hypothetical protein
VSNWRGLTCIRSSMKVNLAQESPHEVKPSARVTPLIQTKKREPQTMTAFKNQDPASHQPDIAQAVIDVDAVLERQLSVKFVKSVRGPMTVEGRPLSTGTLSVVFKVKETGLSGVLVFENKMDGYLLSSINSLNTDRESFQMSDLRDIPLREISDEVEVLINLWDEENPEKFATSFDQVSKERLRRPGRGKSLDDQDLLSLAVKYSELRGKRKIYEILSSEFGYSKNSLKNSICRARREGLLKPTKKGQPNFNLTQKAFDLIKQQAENPQAKEGN